MLLNSESDVGSKSESNPNEVVDLGVVGIAAHEFSDDSTVCVEGNSD